MMSEDKNIKQEYDFSKGERGKFAKLLKNEKTQITIRLDSKTVAYFKCMAEEKDVPYQNLINLYLRSCVEERRTLLMDWPKSESPVS